MIFSFGKTKRIEYWSMLKTIGGGFTATANLTCPYCKHTEKIEVPIDRCLVFYKCKKCKKLLRPKRLCCVICEFSDKKCPVSVK